MRFLKSLIKLLKNPHIYTALIAASVILGAAALSKTEENSDVMIILFGAVISSYLTKTHKKKNCCKY